MYLFVCKIRATKVFKPLNYIYISSFKMKCFMLRYLLPCFLILILNGPNPLINIYKILK